MMSQNITGKVYDNETTVKGIKVYNISQKRVTYTDEKGDFEISAVINDTLFFESLFHHPKHVILKETHFNDVTVFELRKSVNTLGEVIITDENGEKFNPLEYTDVAESALKGDIKNNLHMYIPESSYSRGMNFVEIAKLIGKLFKRKNKPTPAARIQYKHLDSLFKKDKLFNLRLLKDDLNIPEEYATLFLDYCETKNLRKDLMSEANHVILLDSLVNFSREFLKITKTYETSKDSLLLKN